MILKSNHLMAFEAVVEFGTTYGAAKALKLTQTAITQRIKSLESSLGLTLFVRSRKGMSLTDEGKTLLQYSKASNELLTGYLARFTTTQLLSTEITLVGSKSALAS